VRARVALCRQVRHGATCDMGAEASPNRLSAKRRLQLSPNGLRLAWLRGWAVGGTTFRHRSRVREAQAGSGGRGRARGGGLNGRERAGKDRQGLPRNCPACHALSAPKCTSFVKRGRRWFAPVVGGRGYLGRSDQRITYPRVYNLAPFMPSNTDSCHILRIACRAHVAKIRA
jgi:hypothetical protein